MAVMLGMTVGACALYAWHGGAPIGVRVDAAFQGVLVGGALGAVVGFALRVRSLRRKKNDPPSP